MVKTFGNKNCTNLLSDCIFVPHLIDVMLLENLISLIYDN
jgi:hypothetical protein